METLEKIEQLMTSLSTPKEYSTGTKELLLLVVAISYILTYLTY